MSKASEKTISTSVMKKGKRCRKSEKTGCLKGLALLNRREI